MKKICKLCGKEFDSKNGRACCNDIHYKRCISCRQLFEITWATKDKRFCNRECRGKYHPTSKRLFEKPAVKLSEKISLPTYLL